MLTHHQLAGAIVVLIAALGFEAVRHSFESQPLSAVVKLEPRIVVPPLQLTTTDQQHGTHDCGQLGDLVPLTRCDELLGLLSTCGAHEALARAAEEPPATAAAAAVAAAFDQSRQQQGQKVKLKQTQKPKLDVLSPATSLYDVFGASPADEDILPLVQRGVLAYGRETDGDIWDEYDHHRGLDRRLVCAAARAALDECVPECADA